MKQIDRKDHALLTALAKNARQSNKELAATLGVAESTCSQRLRRLEREEVILGYHPQLHLAALGIGLEAMVSVQLVRHSRDRVEAFREHVRGIPEVRAVYHVAGRTDFLIHVAVHDAEHLREMTLSAFTARPEVARIETSLIFEYVARTTLPGRSLA